MVMTTKKIKVLIVDDSALVRQTLKDIISSQEDMEVIGAAINPYAAVKIMQEEKPDVITLDIEMPKMDGITFLKKIMSQHPIPVIICSSLTEKGAQVTMDAIANGTIEIITKPKLGTKEFLMESKIRICDAIRSASKARLSKIKPKGTVYNVPPKLSADVIIPKPSKNTGIFATTEKVIAIGASTGGTQTLEYILVNLPADIPGIVIVQHMPEGFTKNFAQRLDSLCQLSIKEGENNDPVLRGHVIIAPGNKHMLLKRSGTRYFVEIKDGPLVSRHRPSVDVLFRSTARYAGQNAFGFLLTGMGDDGAKGLLEMRESGAFTVAQDEKSSVVFGMPKEAIELDAAQKIMNLEQIIAFITQIGVKYK